jgi:hypothetical protein
MRAAREKTLSTGTRIAAAESGAQPARWRLPSGQTLAEFALRSGLVARRLLEPVRRSAARRSRADLRAKA